MVLVSEEDCPTARYNKEADMFYSYDACATARTTTGGEENTYQDIESGNIVCESEYRNAWIKYRMATWIFILPLFCLVSSGYALSYVESGSCRIYIIIEITEAGRRIKRRRKRNGEVIILVCRITLRRRTGGQCMSLARTDG